MQYIDGGMAMFRNYDGKGSTFGDISVSVTNPDPTDSSLYASDYSTNSARMTLVAINKSTGNLTLQLPLPKAPNGQAFAQAAIYDLTAANSTPQFVENVVITNPADFSYTMPGYSVTTIALTRGLSLRLVCRRQRKLELGGKLDGRRAQCHRHRSRDQCLDHGRVDDHAGQAANHRLAAARQFGQRHGGLHLKRHGHEHADLQQCRQRRHDRGDRRHARHQCPGGSGRQPPGDRQQ